MTLLNKAMHVMDDKVQHGIPIYLSPDRNTQVLFLMQYERKLLLKHLRVLLLQHDMLVSYQLIFLP